MSDADGRFHGRRGSGRGSRSRSGARLYGKCTGISADGGSDGFGVVGAESDVSNKKERKMCGMMEVATIEIKFRI